MFTLNLPEFDANIIVKDGKNMIFDILRKRYVIITPEEWVRQHFIHYLINNKHYPQTFLANEVGLQLNGTKKRCDTVLYDKRLIPQMIIEYKAPHINIAQKVFDQIARYNIVMKVDYLIVSNGMMHYCCKMNYQEQTYSFLTDIPNYEEL
jgi:predicted type IV restriction endonuclease